MDDELYVFFFSYVYYCVYKFVDKEFVFCFVRKLDYKEIKCIVKVVLYSFKVKMIDVFKDNKYFDFDSGEVYLKVKVI